MEHIQEEQLILHYYGESESAAMVDGHLSECAGCRTQYQSLQRLLNSVDGAPVPERSPEYGAQVWAKLAPQVKMRSRFSWLRQRWHWAPLVATAALVVAAFLAGRYTQTIRPVPPVQVASQVRDRVLLVAVSDHLERSQMVLMELANTPANGGANIAGERDLAENLLESNRLYRQTALAAGENNVASVLDDLERVLLEVAHSPDEISSQQLGDIRQRIEERGLLFKVRVLGTRIKADETKPIL